MVKVYDKQSVMPGGGGGGALPVNGLMGMCRWMGSHQFRTGLAIMGSPFQAFFIG